MGLIEGRIYVEEKEIRELVYKAVGEMQSSKTFWERNMKWIITSLLLVGINIGAAKVTLDNKVDKDAISKIVTQEIDHAVTQRIAANSIRLDKLETALPGITKKLDEVLLNTKFIADKLKTNYYYNQ